MFYVSVSVHLSVNDLFTYLCECVCVCVCVCLCTSIYKILYELFCCLFERCLYAYLLVYLQFNLSVSCVFLDSQCCTGHIVFTCHSSLIMVVYMCVCGCTIAPCV